MTKPSNAPVPEHDLKAHGCPDHAAAQVATSAHALGLNLGDLLNLVSQIGPLLGGAGGGATGNVWAILQAVLGFLASKKSGTP